MDFLGVFDELGAVEAMEQAQVDCQRETRAWKRRQKMLEFWRATKTPEQRLIGYQE